MEFEETDSSYVVLITSALIESAKREGEGGKEKAKIRQNSCRSIIDGPQPSDLGATMARFRAPRTPA
jgi:hypothetical protein